MLLPAKEFINLHSFFSFHLNRCYLNVTIWDGNLEKGSGIGKQFARTEGMHFRNKFGRQNF